MEALRDKESRLALHMAAISLHSAAMAGKVPQKWLKREGGLFGQEIFGSIEGGVGGVGLASGEAGGLGAEEEPEAAADANGSDNPYTIDFEALAEDEKAQHATELGTYEDNDPNPYQINFDAASGAQNSSAIGGASKVNVASSSQGFVDMAEGLLQAKDYKGAAAAADEALDGLKLSVLSRAAVIRGKALQAQIVDRAPRGLGAESPGEGQEAEEALREAWVMMMLALRLEPENDEAKRWEAELRMHLSSPNIRKARINDVKIFL